jgi:hypothetical protein
MLETRGAAGPDVAIALTIESGPNLVAKDPIEGVWATGALPSVYPDTCGAGAVAARAAKDTEVKRVLPSILNWLWEKNRNGRGIWEDGDLIFWNCIRHDDGGQTCFLRDRRDNFYDMTSTL